MKHVKSLLFVAAIMTSSVYAAPSNSNDFDQSLRNIQSRWAEINYTVSKDQQEKAFEQLAAQAEQFTHNNPNRAEPMIWQGIVYSTWAGAKGGLGALSLVKQARDLFEQSLRIDDKALGGSAYTSLGSLYYQVPGWPIGFGDDDKAKDYLQKAMQINPDGIDVNYFYADYLIDQGEYQQAENFLQKALRAPARPARPLADRGRRDEIKDKLIMIQKQASTQAKHDSFFN